MTPAWFHRDLYPGDDASDVDVVQVKLRAPRTGVYDSETQARVRGLQRLHQLPVTGIVDELTASLIGEAHWYSPGDGEARDGNGKSQRRAGAIP